MTVLRLTGVANQSKPVPGGAAPPAHPLHAKARASREGRRCAGLTSFSSPLPARRHRGRIPTQGTVRAGSCCLVFRWHVIALWTSTGCLIAGRENAAHARESGSRPRQPAAERASPNSHWSERTGEALAGDALVPSGSGGRPSSWHRSRGGPVGLSAPKRSSPRRRSANGSDRQRRRAVARGCGRRARRHRADA